MKKSFLSRLTLLTLLFSIFLTGSLAAQTGIISGQVTNGSTGLVSIKVSVYDAGNSNIASDWTDASGNYEVTGLPTGNYKLKFEDYNYYLYLREWYNDKADFASADPVGVTDGSPTENINAVLALGGSITGQVTNPSADGIQGVTVTALDLGTNQIGCTGLTDVDGNYTVKQLPTGDCKVNFGPTGLNYFSEYYNDKADFSSADTVSVTAGGTVSDIDAVLAPSGTISGRVTDALTNGIQGVAVWVYDLGQTKLKCCNTDVNGNYSVGLLTTGNYKVEFDSPSGLNYFDEWYNDKADFASADQVGVTAGSTTLNINAVLAVGGEISGQVTNGSSGILNINVKVYNAGDTEVGEDYTDSDGDYSIGGLATGSYKVMFVGSAGYVTEWYNDKADSASADTVGVTAGSITENINAVLVQGGSISGRVTDDSSGAGIENIRVDVYLPEGTIANWDLTDADGYYSVDRLATGSYKVLFNRNLLDYASEWYDDKDGLSSADSVAVISPNDIPNINAQLTYWVEPSITLVSPNGGESWMATTSHDITWTSTGIVPTVDILYTSDSGENWITIASGTENDGSYTWTVPDTPSATCVVRVMEPDGSPINWSEAFFSIIAYVDATVTVTSPNGNESWAPGTTHAITWTQSGLSGNVTIDLYKNGVRNRNIGTAAASAGTFNWTIALTQARARDYKVRVFQGTVEDYSNNNFSIARSPTDFNRDGISDVLWRLYATGGKNRVWQIAKPTTAPNPTEEDEQPVDDFADMQGENVPVPLAVSDTEMMAGHQVVARDPLEEWEETEDLSIDTDLAMAEPESLSVTKSVNLPAQTDLDWQLVATGDFNNNGKVDILWRNTATGANQVWLMNGATRSSIVNLPAQTNLNWQIVATGDFDNDGNTDILWRRSDNGNNSVWFMDGTTYVSTKGLAALTTLSWKICGAGDFNRDGKVDIVWRNEAEGGGENIVWLMNGTAKLSQRSLPSQTNLTWKLSGVGDWDGDGKPDLIWRYYGGGGKNQVWLMNGFGRKATETLPVETNLDWKIEN